ncbi:MULTISPECIES: AtpZ/AtpI family protein [Bacillaceae]|uniref:AtpZ/AtpI family protein n=1 Tax=Bacillaceae TaxID=186817 RepID=UPI00047B3233|nr:MULTISPECIES: AtpZ/AtpI family protein [Bacillaceae]UOE93948.1 AtpZ/AtpI family protein [Alkalihalobacillus sp. LMS39]
MSLGRRSMRAMALVSIISSYIVGGVLAGVFIGNWIDERFATKPLFLIIFLLLGIGSGFYGVYKVIQPYLGDNEQ